MNNKQGSGQLHSECAVGVRAVQYELKVPLGGSLMPRDLAHFLMANPRARTLSSMSAYVANMPVGSDKRC